MIIVFEKYGASIKKCCTQLCNRTNYIKKDISCRASVYLIHSNAKSHLTCYYIRCRVLVDQDLDLLLKEEWEVPHTITYHPETMCITIVLLCHQHDLALES